VGMVGWDELTPLFQQRQGWQNHRSKQNQKAKTQGRNPMSGFTLSAPFALAGGDEIKDLEDPIEYEAGGLTFLIKRDGRRFRLRVSGFETEEEAQAHFARVWCALAWFSVTENVGFDLPGDFRSVGRGDRLGKSLGMGEVQGAADAGGPIVYPSDSGVLLVEGGPVKMFRSYPAETFLAGLVDAYLRIRPAEVDNRTRTAVDLFAVSFYETTSHAKLLTLVTCLEAMSQPRKRSISALTIIETWRKLLKEETDCVKQESDREDLGDEAKDALEEALQGLDALRGLLKEEESHGSAVRRMVREELAGLGREQVEDRVRKARDCYSVRGKFLHDGRGSESEISEAANQAREIVSEILLARLSGRISDQIE